MRLSYKILDFVSECVFRARREIIVELKVDDSISHFPFIRVQPHNTPQKLDIKGPASPESLLRGDLGCHFRVVAKYRMGLLAFGVLSDSICLHRGTSRSCYFTRVHSIRFEKMHYFHNLYCRQTGSASELIVFYRYVPKGVAQDLFFDPQGPPLHCYKISPKCVAILNRLESPCSRISC
jgi:hypothetical protein